MLLSNFYDAAGHNRFLLCLLKIHAINMSDSLTWLCREADGLLLGLLDWKTEMTAKSIQNVGNVRFSSGL